MPEITLVKLKELSVKIEELADRYDIEKSVYEDLLHEREHFQKLMKDNPALLHSKEEYNEVFCLNGYMIICLLSKINELNDAEAS